MSGIIWLISIVLFVLLVMINPENGISVYNYYFNYLLYNNLIYLQNIWLSYILENLGGRIK